jgi:exosortase
MQTSQSPRLTRTQQTVSFGLLIAISVFVFWRPLLQLIAYSTDHESSSHIVLIPIVTAYLIFTERSKIFAMARTSFWPGVVAIALGAGLYAFANSYYQTADQLLPATSLAIVVVWIGIFILLYGTATARRAIFPLTFMLLMVPLPPLILDRTITLLQEGSTQIAVLLFHAAGVPVLRNGFILALPGVTIEVAKECSGIRSSVALFITCLLAAHLFLRTTHNRIVFSLIAFPLAIIKNGIRITTLTLLSIYVNPGFLTGKLHHQGGFVFFLGAMALLIPILLFLQRAEEKGDRTIEGPTIPIREDGIVRQR